MTDSTDPWVILPKEKARYEEQFRSLNPVNGIVTGEQAKGFLLKSQLPPPVLGQIWALADTDADGKMDISEFSIACKLINLKLRNFALPQKLPASLLQSLKTGSAATPPAIPPLPQPSVLAALSHPSSVVGPPPLISSTVPQSSAPPLTPAPPIARPPIPRPPLSRPLVGVSLPSSAPLNILPNITSNTQNPLIDSGITTAPLNVMPATVGVQSISSSIPGNTNINAPLVMMPLPIPPSAPLGITQQPVSGVVNQSVPPPRPPSVPALDRIGLAESSSALQEWAVPHQTKLKYTQVFNSIDRARTGFLSGPQARNIMVGTMLPQHILAQIWTLADMDSDGRLSCDEFVLALHLCDLAKQGEKIPAVLPPDLIPPTFRRARQGSLQGTGLAAGEQIEGKDGLPGQVTFEDKRKQNFEKGQAELEKRRKALMEIQRKEQEERERKEKEEQEKKEKLRLEQEQRRQMELEKQLQKQREIEMEREEQRKKAQEQREAARREMERQRHLEWEKQRCQDLQQQRQKEQENVLRLKARNQNLKIELSQLTEKVKELSQKITDTRLGVTTVKTTIDGMRTTRDTQLQEMSSLKSRLKEQNQRLVALSQEKIRLEARNKLNAANPANEEQAKVAFTNKQILLKQLRDKLEDLNKEVESKLSDIENNNSQLGDLKQELTSLINDCEGLYTLYEERRKKILALKGHGNTDYSTAWSEDVSNIPAWDTPANAGWSGTTNGDISAPKDMLQYRALYEFVARNADELSFQIGDIIMVPVNQNAEPGWLAGEVHGYTGWFPESYVEPVDSNVSINRLAANVSISDEINTNQLQNMGEFSENIIGNGSLGLDEDIGPSVNNLESPVLGQGTAVDGVMAQSLYSWEGKRSSHLSFKKGDVIMVTEQQDNWWYGDLAGNKGWFPKSYVNVIDNVPVNESEEYCVAMYPYQSSELGDLSFQQGEIITVIKKEGEWWTGIIGDRQGIFPSNYVQKTEIKSEESAIEPKVTEKLEKVLEREAPASKAPVSAGECRAKGKKPEIATVIAPYQATSSEQLSLQRGQLIMIRKKTSTGWWEGELQAKGKKKQVGWFPASYVKTLGAKDKVEQQQTLPLQPTQPIQHEEKVVALFTYQAQNEDELSFAKDDVILLLSKEEESWWKGELNGVSGLFPSNYVAPLYSVYVDEAERKRQGYIEELFSTEEAYIEDMTVVHEVFEKPLVESKVLSEEEIQTIFVNWRDIIVCNHMFLRALRVRRDMSDNGVIRIIGDILCENLPRMTPYIRFCSCQLSAAKFLQHLTETSQEFREIARQCQCDPRTKGMPLSSFLIKPMQRITKYPLLIKKILEHTSVDHPDRHNLQEALLKAEEFCMQVNEGVREQENSDRLEWLQRQVSCEGLEEELVFNSLTNCLGPRKLIHFGVLYKAKSGKELVSFLFNDFLMFAQTSKSLGHHGFTFDMNTNNNFKLYKKPVFLSHLILVNDEVRPITPVGSDVSDTHSRSLKFQDSQNKTLYHLLAPTVKDQILWHKKITEALESFADTQKKHMQYQKSKAAQFGARGRILVVIMRGVGFKPISSSGKLNIFCKVSMGSQEHRTPTTATTSEAVWNTSMQFLIKDLDEDVLCITVFDEGHFSPDEFLGRTEVRVCDIWNRTRDTHGPVHGCHKLREVESGEIVTKMDVIMFSDDS